MKKQIQPGIRAHLIRSAFYVLSLPALCVIPFALAQRNATNHGLPAITSSQLICQMVVCSSDTFSKLRKEPHLVR